MTEFTTSLVPLDARVAVLHRIQHAIRALVQHRTAGARGSVRAELQDLAMEIGCTFNTVTRLYGWHGAIAGAKKGGTSRKTVNPYLPRLDIVIRLCVVANISADWLLLGRGRAPAWWDATRERAA